MGCSGVCVLSLLVVFMLSIAISLLLVMTWFVLRHISSQVECSSVFAQRLKIACSKGPTRLGASLSEVENRADFQNDVFVKKS